MQSDVATISRPVQNVVVLDGVPILHEASSTQLIPFTPSSSVTRTTDSYSFADITHDEYQLELSQKKIHVFRAFRKNIPKEDYICDLIGVQVYQWTSCTEEQQPCDKFCRRCNFCCHQFYCTCRPYKLRTLSWCKHIHAATCPVKNEKESVVFVMDTWQMSQPPQAHLRAMCYDLDNGSVSMTNDVFLVKEFNNLRAEVTRGNMNQMCGDCFPKCSCSTCDICLHVYKCVCHAFRQGELCEHCHVVALYKKKFEDMLKRSGFSKQMSGSNRISKQASNSGDTSTQASGSGGTSNMALDSNTESGSRI